MHSLNTDRNLGARAGGEQRAKHSDAVEVCLASQATLLLILLTATLLLLTILLYSFDPFNGLATQSFIVTHYRCIITIGVE